MGTLTREEYSCTGSFSKSSDHNTPVSQTVAFDRIFLEPPIVTASFSYNQDNRYSNIVVSNITTSNCVISASYVGNSTYSCTITWKAMGYVKKSI